jgi:hypothetical protein
VKSVKVRSGQRGPESKSRSPLLGGLDLLDLKGNRTELEPSAPQLRTGGHATSDDRAESR